MLNISNEYLTITMHSALLSGTVLFILGEELIAKFKSKYYLIITGVGLILTVGSIALLSYEIVLIRLVVVNYCSVRVKSPTKNDLTK